MHDVEAGVPAPAEYLLLGVARGVGRVIPVEVDQIADALTELPVPETFEERPVHESLHIVLAGLEPEQRNALLQCDGCPKP